MQKQFLAPWHEWAQALPIADNVCVCTLCGAKAPMRKLGEAGSCKVGQTIPISWLPAKAQPRAQAALEAHGYIPADEWAEILKIKGT